MAEHHSNLVPWQLIAQRTGAVIKHVKLTENNQELDMQVRGSTGSSSTGALRPPHVVMQLLLRASVWIQQLQPSCMDLHATAAASTGAPCGQTSRKHQGGIPAPNPALHQHLNLADAVPSTR